jgi:hypothetical protein
MIGKGRESVEFTTQAATKAVAAATHDAFRAKVRHRFALINVAALADTFSEDF